MKQVWLGHDGGAPRTRAVGAGYSSRPSAGRERSAPEKTQRHTAFSTRLSLRVDVSAGFELPFWLRSNAAHQNGSRATDAAKRKSPPNDPLRHGREDSHW